MTQEHLEMLLRLIAALAAGGMDRDRTKLSRPPCRFPNPLPRLRVVQRFDAGSPYTNGNGFSHMDWERVNLDPTRMSQGIMTGIGFLGAGVIMKEGFVRARSDDSGIDLDHGLHRHTRGYRLLLSRRHRDDPHPGHVVGLSLDRNEDAYSVPCHFINSIHPRSEDGRARPAAAGGEATVSRSRT